jgi:hypothetical protein
MSWSGANAGEAPIGSVAANSPNTLATPSIWRWRPIQLTLVARSGKRRASATATLIKSNGLRGQNPGQDYGREGVESLHDRVSRARQGVGAWVLPHEALDDGGEQRLLIGKPSVDRWFPCFGFLLVASFLGALEVVLDRGLEDDWFGSGFIVTFTAICAVAFVLMIPWELSRKDPMIDMRMVGSRQFGACFLVMGATGAILYATTQYLPLMVQTVFGYTATWAGLVLSPGGLVTMVTMFIVGQVSTRIQPKYLIMTGAIFAAISMYQLTNVYADLDFWTLAKTRTTLGVGLPLIFIPIIAASYDGIPANRVDMASALINAARNTGGSIGVSIASNVLTHREQFHQSRLIEHLTPSSPQYQNTLQQVTHYFTLQGFSPGDAHARATAWIGQQVQNQSAFLSYVDVFWVLMLLSLAAVPPAEGQARRGSGARGALTAAASFGALADGLREDAALGEAWFLPRAPRNARCSRQTSGRVSR